MPRKSGRGGSRATYINIRYRITRKGGMSVTEARKLLRRAIITGFVPEGIEIAWVDWQNGTGHRAKSYEYVGDEAIEALIRARGILLADSTRLRSSVVDSDGEEYED